MHPVEFLRIREALRSRGLALSDDQAERCVAYAELLLHWNRRINLVGTQDRQELYTRHILDCLMLGTLPWPPRTRTAIDIGSGAGLPGVLVALLHPECRVISVERVAKKTSFQQVARDTLGLLNFVPVRGDARHLPPTAGTGGATIPARYDLALARALARLDELLALARDLLVPGGMLWAMKGRRLARERADLPPELRGAFAPEPSVYNYDFGELDGGGCVVAYCLQGERP